MTDLIRLRPHHLLCMLTYVGKGYTPGFVVNYDRIITRLNAGAEIEVVDGPDDVCGPVACLPGSHCHLDGIRLRDALAAEAVAAWLGRDTSYGARLSLAPRDITRLREGFATGDIRKACTGCDWEIFCTRIASDGYRGARLSSEEVSCTTAPVSAAR